MQRNCTIVKNSGQATPPNGSRWILLKDAMRVVIALRIEQLPVCDGEDDAEELCRGVQQTGGRSLGLRVGDLSGELKPDRQITGHEEPEQAGRDVHHADVAHREGERVGDHAAHAQGVYRQSGAPGDGKRSTGRLWGRYELQGCNFRKLIGVLKEKRMLKVPSKSLWIRISPQIWPTSFTTLGVLNWKIFSIVNNIC